MVISIEPGIYIPDCGGFRHSDTVLVTETGYELLTCLPTDLASLTISGWRLFTRLKGWLIRRALRVGHKAQVAGLTQPLMGRSRWGAPQFLGI